MFYFKLTHSLQLQYDALLTKLHGMYVSREMYLLEENMFTAVGRPFSVSVSLADGNVAGAEQREEWNSISPDMLPVISEDTPCGELMRYIIMRLRAALNVQPCANAYMLSTLRGKINEQLKNFNIRITDSDETMPVVSLQMDGIDMNVEFVIVRLMMGSVPEEDGSDEKFDMHYAKRVMGLMRYEEALGLFLNELNNHDPSTMLYTELCMYIGEIYYHLNERENALVYYRKCDPRFVGDENDLYSRIGHAILDDGTGLRGDMIRMYYRCLLNPTYKKSIADKYDRLAEQVEPIYAEHEAKCVEAGRYMK